MLIKKFEDSEVWQEARKLVSFETVYSQAQSVRKLADGFIRYLRNRHTG